MKNLYFDDFEDFSCVIADTYDALDYDEEDVAIIAKYEEARQIIKELLCLGYDIHSINVIDEEYGEYDAEYIISLYNDEVWCEPMLRENGYLTDDSPVMYILDNCSSKVIPYCKGETVYEVTVGDENCSCDDCEECLTINGRPATKEEFDAYVSQFKKSDEKPITTSSAATYRVNGKEVDKETFESALADIEDRCLDNVRDMLLGYCEIIDEVNDWRSRFLRW